MADMSIEDFQKQLQEWEDNLKSIDGNNTVEVHDLFIPEFMKAHSKFADFDSFFEASGASPEERLEDIPDEKLDPFVQQVTDFESFQDMLDTASEDWVHRQIGF